MWQRLRLPSARRLVASGLALSAIVGIAAAMACSFLISDKLPAGYTCLRDAGDVCPVGQVCAPGAVGTQFTCVPKCTTNSDCVPGERCDEVGWCVTITDGGGTSVASGDGSPGQATPSDAGGDAATNHLPCSGYACPCSAAADCPSGLACIDKTAVTQDIWNAWVDAGVGADGSSGMCLAPCCTSAVDCDDFPGNVCFATGAGGNYCVPSGWLGDRSTIGANIGGQACGGDAGACRSGLCLSTGVCGDTCCSNFSTTECAPSATCRFGPFSGPTDSFDKHETARCVPTGAAGAGATGGGACNTNTDCRSDYCFIDAGGGGFGGGGNGGGQQPPTGACRDACRNPDECVTTATRNSPQASCSYMPPVAGNADLVAACMHARADGHRSRRCRRRRGLPYGERLPARLLRGRPVPGRVLRQR